MSDRIVNAALADDSTLRIVATDEYEALKGPGIAAPWPGHACAYIEHQQCGAGDLLFITLPGEEEQEVGWPAKGERIELPPGSVIRVVATPGIRLEMW